MRAYRDPGFPVTVVRPSHTYDRTKIALPGGWTDIHRMRHGLPVLVHGDGTSLWTLTHSRSFQCSIPFADGVREIVRWHDGHPAMQKVDAGFMELTDRLVGWARRP